MKTTEEWWAKNAAEIAAVMEKTGVSSLEIHRKADGKYRFEITPEKPVAEQRPPVRADRDDRPVPKQHDRQCEYNVGEARCSCLKRERDAEQSRMNAEAMARAGAENSTGGTDSQNGN